MSNEEQMSIDERYKYLRKMQKRYQKVKRKERSRLLDEMEEVTGLHRKSITRLMGKSIERKPRKKQRGKVYGPEVKAVVSVVAESLDWICAERIQPALLSTAKHLAQHGELVLSREVKEKLEQISIATVGRMLTNIPRDRPRLYRRSSQRANRLAREIPAGRIPWDITEPGHFEADLVHHSGPSASGQYVHSLQMVDAATGWSERAALLGRSYLVTKDGFERLQARIPFPIREVHPDNGPEFLNQHVVRYWGEQPGLTLTRSRPWQKNDNRFVEQKNATLIRAYLGNDRLDTVEHTRLLNQLYVQMGRYYNLFQPVMRLAEKTIVHAPDGRSVRFKRRFDQAQTPFDRLCATGALDPEQQRLLEALRTSLNPRQLRHDIYALLDRLFALPGACPEHASQDVYLTLFNPPASVNSPIATGDFAPGPIK